MKLGIVGKGRAGKDTAAEYLAATTDWQYVAGTSYCARGVVFKSLPWWLRLWYRTPERAWKHRHKRRDHWAKKIGEHNLTVGAVRFYADCLQGQDILTGVRWRSEFLQIRHLCDVWLYICRPDCVDDTCQVTPWDCDYLINNDGTLEEFCAKLDRFASILRLPPKEKPQTELNPLRYHKDEFGMYCWHAGNVDLMSGSPPASTP